MDVMDSSVLKVAVKRAVLCVEDDTESREVLEATLGESRIVFARTAFEAIRSLNNDVFDTYLLDYWLPGWSGVQLCREIRKMDPHGPIVFCTAATRDVDRQRAMRAGASAFVCKPVEPELLRSRVHVLQSLADAESDLARPHAQQALEGALDEFTLKLAALGRAGQASVELLERAARTRAYTAFIAHRGTRASFERWWAAAFPGALSRRPALRQTADGSGAAADGSMSAGAQRSAASTDGSSTPARLK